jgi:phosphoglycolate phosphatase
MMAPRLRVDAVLFDLDGTLVDTLPDITWCLNRVLLEEGCPVLTADTVRGYIGGGTRAMIGQVAAQFGIAGAAALHQRYMTLYQHHLVQFSRPFNGVWELLEGCRQLELPLAIVTNKAEDMALEIAGSLFAQNTFATVLGQCTGRSLKPQPDVAWEAARQLSVDPRRCLFVGDTEIDLQTARAAGMPSAMAAWGYGRTCTWQAQSPNFYCQHPLGLLRALQQVCAEQDDTVKSC